LYEVHRATGAKMVEFGGWKMPVQYSGPEAAKLMDYVTTNWASRLKCGRARYSGPLYEHGGFVDHILARKVADDSFFLCVNASNQEKDFVHMQAANKFDCVAELTGMRGWRSRARRRRKSRSS
jgi:aminomethyltransferase